MWGIKYLIAILFFGIVQCPPKITEYLVDMEMMSSYIPQNINKEDIKCSDNLAYVPDTLTDNVDNIKFIRMNFHFINTSDWKLNYNGESGKKYARDLVHFANEKLVDNRKMKLPEGNTNPAYNPRYKYVIHKDGIFFHADDELAYYVNEGKGRNNYKRDVIKKYAVGEDSVLNVFYMIHHPDSVRSKTYSASSAGVALGKSLKLGTKFNPEDPPWKYAALLNHEVGHVMGLSHTWNLNDGCDDTPKHPNCWASTDSGRCKGLTSNNLMDYNSNQHAISPCQIGKMRKNMTSLGSKQRDLVQSRWCKLNPEKLVVIRGDVHFKGAKELEGNILVKSGSSLTISCRLSIPPDGEIRLEPGAKLVLDNAHLHNSCGMQWEGIIAMEDANEKAQVFRNGDVKIEDVKGLLPEVE